MGRGPSWNASDRRLGILTLLLRLSLGRLLGTPSLDVSVKTLVLPQCRVLLLALLFFFLEVSGQLLDHLLLPLDLIQQGGIVHEFTRVDGTFVGSVLSAEILLPKLFKGVLEMRKALAVFILEGFHGFSCGFGFGSCGR